MTAAGTAQAAWVIRQHYKCKGWEIGEVRRRTCHSQLHHLLAWRCSVRSIMEAKKFAEDAVREFLLFRGFTDTLQSFESELHAQCGSGFYLLARVSDRYSCAYCVCWPLWVLGVSRGGGVDRGSESVQVGKWICCVRSRSSCLHFGF